MDGRGFAIAAIALGVVACDGLGQLDYRRIYGRGGWQRPQQVVEALGIQPGDRVADIGAGGGYFLPYLAEAVGPKGRVYAVEVDEELTRALEEEVRREGLANVEVVLGEPSEPSLPDGQLDLVFLCNTYHHIEDRPAYFARLRSDLSETGRVAVVDPDAELGGVLRLFQHEGHRTASESLVGEMQEAGYRRSASFDFLATQIFEVFSPD